MRFILVNGRTPRLYTFCALCRKPVGANYLREVGTHLIYCDHDCFADHCESAIQLFDGHARAAANPT